MKAQLPRYQRLIPRPGQAHSAAPPVAAVGSIMPPQQGMPPQQPGMRHPMHGKKRLPRLYVFYRCTEEQQHSAGSAFFMEPESVICQSWHCALAVFATGQYGAPPQGMPSYMPGGMPPYGQGPPMVPPYQGGPPIGMRPPAMSPAGRYWSSKAATTLGLRLTPFSPPCAFSKLAASKEQSDLWRWRPTLFVRARGH